MPFHMMLIIFLSLGCLIGHLITILIIRRIRTNGSVIFEYSFGWIPETATLPQTVSHAQELNLSKSNHIILDHKPITSLQVTVRDTRYNEIVQFYIN